MTSADFLSRVGDKVSIVEAVAIDIEDFGTFTVSDFVHIVKVDGQKCIYLGEIGEWHHVAPLNTLKSKKCEAGDIEHYFAWLSVSSLMSGMRL